MLLSIIIPVYNCEKYLRKCVDSIFSQDLTKYELILVDDGSVDSSAEICDYLSTLEKKWWSLFCEKCWFENCKRRVDNFY